MGYNELANALMQTQAFQDLQKQQPDNVYLADDILNGLNKGSQAIAQWQAANNIRIPQTQADIDLAQAHSFNLPNEMSNNVGTAPSNAFQIQAQAKPSWLDNLSMGYGENYNNPVNTSNFRYTPKPISNRIGEGLGTAMRFIDSPLGRGLAAGLISNALGATPTNVAKEALGAFTGFQNNQTADKLYRNQLKQYGYTDADLSQIRGFINNDMYKNLSQNLYRNLSLSTRMAIANAKDKTTKAKLILEGWKNNTLSEQDALNELALNGISLNEINAKTAKIKKETEYVGKPKTTISIRKGGTKSVVDINHNGGGISQETPKSKPTKATQQHKINAF